MQIDKPSNSNSSSQYPVIVIGMHRSGTSMITGMLEPLGLFAGVSKDANKEAYFFMQLNEWMLGSSGASWDNPAPFRYLLSHRTVRAMTTDYLKQSMECPRASEYLGWREYTRVKSLQKMKRPWGWKDPRNNFTLPLWLDVFPNARVIRIFRHGVHVASSCRMAYAPKPAALDAAIKRYAKRKPLYNWRPMRSGFAYGLRVSTLEGAFSLWEEYVRQGRKLGEEFHDQTIQVQYEDFLARPIDNLERLANFCGLHSTQERIAEVATGVRKERAFAFLKDPELSAFALSVADRLAEFGYGPFGQGTYPAEAFASKQVGGIPGS